MNKKENTNNEVINFIETFNVYIGKKINFKEAICTNQENFDRHFTTFSSTEFILTDFGARISGARIMFGGEKLNYEISFDRITKFEKNENQIIIFEAYSENIIRRTFVNIL